MVRALDSGKDAEFRSHPDYTPESATETLPLVRRIVADMVRLDSNINAQREQLSVLDERTEAIERDSYRDEVRDVRMALAHDESLLNECMAELAAMGIQPHIPIDGRVDFPAKRNRRNVLLCWDPSDATVCHWHEVDSLEPRCAITSDETTSSSH